MEAEALVASGGEADGRFGVGPFAAHFGYNALPVAGVHHGVAGFEAEFLGSRAVNRRPGSPVAHGRLDQLPAELLPARAKAAKAGPAGTHQVFGDLVDETARLVVLRLAP